jgi:hypothetical protein
MVESLLSGWHDEALPFVLDPPNFHPLSQSTQHGQPRKLPYILATKDQADIVCVQSSLSARNRSSLRQSISASPLLALAAVSPSPRIVQAGAMENAKRDLPKVHSFLVLSLLQEHAR